MNENLNLVEILKDCPEGTKLYSPVYGDVELVSVSRNEEAVYPIEIKKSNNALDSFAKDGRLYTDYAGECMLFPSREQRDWSKFKVKKPKFDPKTLKPFDKVLGRYGKDEPWHCELFSHIGKGVPNRTYSCVFSAYKYCIPYNDDTKHLAGTSDEAPEFYRYWEE